jgi:DNA-binding response OmpR family regulator
MPHKTILVIDDNSDFVDALKEAMLIPWGYNVLHATNGQTGLDMSATHNPDLIILDMNLPHMTGLEVLTTLRQNSYQVPVIFMTMYGSECVAVEAFRLGVCDYLPKPFSSEDMHQAIQRTLYETGPTQEKELDSELVVAETVRQTAITLSHYINNHLMALTGGLSLLQENLSQEFPNHPTISKIVQDGQASIAQIETVIRVLQRVTEVRQTPYHDHIRMIDIEAALRKELGQ